MQQDLAYTRRDVLLLASGTVLASWSRAYGSESDFWNKKDPAQWSSEEIDKLTSKSPWAKEVSASTEGAGRGGRMGRGGMGRVGGMGIPGVGYPGGGYPGGGYPGGGYPGGGYPGGGYPRGGGGTGYPDDTGGGYPGGGRGMSFHGVVRWESAKPILDALKTPLPEALANHYVISVSGIPMLASRQQRSDDGQTDTTISQGMSEDMLERLKGLTYLEPKGKEPAQPGVVQLAATTSRETKTVLFGFSKDLLHLGPEDKEVSFTTQFGRAPIKAKFNLKEMVYRGALAL
ncbi:MAG TPA: hypothetical protein VFA33_08120 [Bryobacteraceae bacterium]|nr:hypothetical protein [Bryobacteraceae bacterium]